MCLPSVRAPLHEAAGQLIMRLADDECGAAVSVPTQSRPFQPSFRLNALESCHTVCVLNPLSSITTSFTIIWPAVATTMCRHAAAAH